MEKKPTKEKKPLTTLQKKRRYRGIQWGCIVGEFLSVIAPYITIGAIKFDEYFVQTGADSWKVTLGGILAMAVMGIAICTFGREQTKDNRILKITMMGFGWLMASFILFLLSAIIGDVAFIMLCGAIGIFVAAGLDVTSQTYKKKADKYKAYLEDKEMRESDIDNDVNYELKKKKKIEEKQRRAVE